MCLSLGGSLLSASGIATIRAYGDAWRARPERPHRIWVLLFLVAGLPAMFSAMVLPFDPALALPWVGLSSPPAALAGYHIWRARIPMADAGHELAGRARRAIGVVYTAVVVTLAGVYPQFVALIVGLWLAAILLALCGPLVGRAWCVEIEGRSRRAALPRVG